MPIRSAAASAPGGAGTPAGLALLSHGFRPFFLLAALTAALALPVWLAAFLGGASLPGPLAPLQWHIHEMIWGYLAAVLAGFLLTAIPNWTGRLPLAGVPLAGLVALWLAGRVAMFALPHPILAAAIDLLFLPVLAVAAWREVLAGGSRRNMPVVGLISLFAVANLLFHLAQWVPAMDGAGTRLALAVAAMLIALIGGRILPSFTHNWMLRQNIHRLPAAFGRFDKAALVVTAAALAAWTFRPDWPGSGALLLAAAALSLLRLARWHGEACWREPILAVLHLGYLWLVLSLALMGAAIVLPALVPASAALHGLTAGTIGTMTLAVMSRASLGHTGRPVTADRWTLACYLLVTAGAALRVAAPWCGEAYATALALGGGAWSAAFGLFALRYAPILLRPRPAHHA